MKLETERLLLRPWKTSDLADLVEGLDNYNVSRWMSRVPCPYGESDAAEWLDYCSSLVGDYSYEFAIELKGEGKVIGGVTLNNIDRLQGTAGGGIWINEDYQKNGYGIEAFAERIRFAFDDLGLRRIENGCFSGNAPSQKMLYRLGYNVEGIRRKGLICLADGEYKDEVICGLMKEDWLTQVIPLP